ncbi:hypothetical protein JTB14_034064 [Gonioctena quinquepunctata]|nr:hypothetical protein JTB14_034064 [Gonioctena quinquepunctata]
MTSKQIGGKFQRLKTMRKVPNIIYEKNMNSISMGITVGEIFENTITKKRRSSLKRVHFAELKNSAEFQDDDDMNVSIMLRKPTTLAKKELSSETELECFNPHFTDG